MDDSAPKRRVAKTLQERFWAKVNKAGAIPSHAAHLGECWEWTGCISTEGYGKIAGANRKVSYAHRISYELAFGSLPTSTRYHGVVVGHRCDNRKCVRPEHLTAMTQGENLRDMAQKDRVAHGERSAAHKLTEAQVRQIRLDYDSGTPQTVLSERFGVGTRAISKIVTRIRWARVA